MTTAKADDDGCRQWWHARLGSGLQQERTKVGGKRRQRQQSGNDVCGGERWQWGAMTAKVDNDSGRQQQPQTAAACKIGQWTMMRKIRAGGEQQQH
jgi:hypothetical protein